MQIKSWSKWKIRNRVFVLNKSFKKFQSKSNKNFFEKHLKLKSWEKFTIWYYTNFDSKNIDYTIFVKYTNNRDFYENIEDIVAWLWDMINSINKDFFIDLDSLDLPDSYRNLFQELLSIKLYKYSKNNPKKDKSESKLVIKNKNFANFNNFVESISLVRDLVNSPSNLTNPDSMEETIKSIFEKENNVEVEVFDKDKLLDLWMNWIYEVWKWADIPPRLVLIKYNLNKNEDYHFSMVWKGVCFDTWGYNLKPTWAIEDMRLDMWWAATVLWVTKHLVQNWYSKNFITAIPLVENNISSKAYKPWDVITMYNWKTVFVWNTDAEWRLILADALSYVEKEYSPKYLFDIATLTWAQIIALGTKIAAIIWRNQQLNKKIQKISWDIKERFWELPFYEPYFKSHKTYLADMNNIGSFGKAWPWTISAWLFLSQFVESKNWAHLDIAWPAWIFGGNDSLWWEWASGFGFRTLVNLAYDIQKK